MADNEVKILVTSENRTKEGFASAKKDAETAGDQAGQGFAQRFASRMMMALAAAGGSGGGKGSPATFFETFGSQFGGLATGALVAAPAIAAVVVELVGVASGVAAVAAGLGAFGILSIGTFSQLKQDASQYATALDNLNNKQNIAAISPTKTNLAAVKKAQVELQATLMGMGQDAGTAAVGLTTLRLAYDKLSAAMQPLTFKVIGEGLKVANDLLPTMVAPANAFGNALSGLLKQFDKFAQSKGFQDWLKQFDKIIGPATTAIGQGLGKLIISIGKLFTIMSAHDVVHSLNILFDFLAGFFNGLAKWIQGAMNNWDRFSGSMKEAGKNISAWAKRAESDLANWAQVVDNIVHNVNNWFAVTLPTAIATAIHWFQSLPGKVLAALAALPGMLFSAGANAVKGLISGAESMIGNLVSRFASMAHAAANAIGSVFGIHFSEPSEATQMIKAGRNIAAGLVKGYASGPSLGGMALGGLGGGHGGVTLEISGSGNAAFDAFMLQYIRHTVRIKGGGSVQAAFGRG